MPTARQKCSANDAYLAQEKKSCMHHLVCQSIMTYGSYKIKRKIYMFLFLPVSMYISCNKKSNIIITSIKRYLHMKWSNESIIKHNM